MKTVDATTDCLLGCIRTHNKYLWRQAMRLLDVEALRGLCPKQEASVVGKAHVAFAVEQNVLRAQLAVDNAYTFHSSQGLHTHRITVDSKNKTE